MVDGLPLLDLTLRGLEGGGVGRAAEQMERLDERVVLVSRDVLADIRLITYSENMVNTALMRQVDRLSPSELVELHDAIQAKLDDIPTGQWAILEQRVAEANANPDDYITLDEWKARRRARRTA
ncbi:MAG: hypothetical protein ABF811_07570 [Pseudoclavibacter sp.]